MSNEKRGDVKWLVAFACIRPEFLSNPAEFLSKPESRRGPTWACGVIYAADEHEAYTVGAIAWENGLLKGPQPGQDFWVMNWYVAPLGDNAIDLEVIGATQLRRCASYRMYESEQGGTLTMKHRPC